MQNYNISFITLGQTANKLQIVYLKLLPTLLICKFYLLTISEIMNNALIL
jgi:hypothetical protein